MKETGRLPSNKRDVESSFQQKEYFEFKLISVPRYQCSKREMRTVLGSGGERDNPTDDKERSRLHNCSLDAEEEGNPIKM